MAFMEELPQNDERTLGLPPANEAPSLPEQPSEERVIRINIDEETALAPLEIKQDEKPNLTYLRGISPGTLLTLTTQYQKTIQELDDLVGQHRSINRAFVIWYCLANYYSCLLYLSFPIATNSQGNQTVLQEVGIDDTIPDYINYSVFWPFIIIYIIWDIMFFSVSVEAAQSTLYYLHRKIWHEILKEYYDEASADPEKWLSESAEEFIYQFIKIPCNFTGIMSELVYIPLDYTSPFGLFVVAFTLLFGNEYYRKCINIEFDKGVIFFKNKANLPWIFWERNFMTWLNATSQGLSAVGLNVFPLYYFLALASAKLLNGFWFPAIMVGILKFFHSMFTAYPASYHFYMDDYLNLLNYMREDDLVQTQLLKRLDFKKMEINEKNFNHELVAMLFERHENFKHNLLQKHDFLIIYLIKQDLATSLLILVYAALGTYGGYGIAQHLTDEMHGAEYIFLPIGALLLGISVYYAELERVVMKQQYKQEKQLKDPEPYKTDSLSTFINVMGNFIGATSMIGTLKPLVGNDAPEVTTVVTLLALQRMLNYISFSRTMVKESLKGFYENLPSLQECKSVFFKKSPKMQTSSITAIVYDDARSNNTTTTTEPTHPKPSN